MSAVAPEDVGRAGRGDLAALRRMRDHWLELATGEAKNALIPKDEALPQCELLAELAACGGDEPEDWMALLVAYCIRIEALQGHVGAAERLAKEAAEADNAADLDRWTISVVGIGERIEHYRAKIVDLVSALISSRDPEGAALLASTLSREADQGDERAVPVLQFIMDSVTPDRASAISAAVRKLEGASTQ